MSSAPTPTWYDVLGVSRDASPEQIKAAWRSSTDKFEPGSGSSQFRMFSEAADVLLDPERRAAYDRSLDTEQPLDAPADVPMQATTGVIPLEEPKAEPRRERAERKRTEKSASTASSPSVREPASGRAKLVAGALAVLTVLALGLAGYFATQVRQDAQVADARSQAPAAAERAAKALLSYDYKQLPTDRERASGFLTDKYKKEYLRTFSLLEKNKDGTPGAAIQTKAVVQATVLGTGVVDAEGGVARVLVYVNQVSEKEGQDPQIFQNRVAMTMEQVGNRWLVDDLKSY